jgi:ABC-2 type transport system permease protein
MTLLTPPQAQQAPPRPSGPTIVRSIMAKDAVAFSRNRFIMFITVLVLVVWAVIYQFLPTTVDETFAIGVVVEEGSLDPALLEGLELDALGEPEQVEDGGTTGVAVTVYPTRTDLEQAVDTGDDVTAGLVIPSGFTADLETGAAEVILVVPAGLPPQYESLLESAAQEIGFALTGQAPPVDLATQTQIVGTDRVGDQISLAEQMRPLLLVVVLLMEVFALSTLVAGEIQERTATALLATPANTGHLITAKGLFGTALAFSEVVLLGLLIGAFATSAPLVLTALLLGAFMVTGLGLLAGAFGRDFMDTLIMGMLIMIPLIVPAMAALFPGEPALWVKILPTYGLVETVIEASAGGLTWGDAAGALAAMAAWGVGLLALGAWTLNRRVARL